MRPYPPYPSEDETPAGPPWAQLLPGQRSPIDESTTEVPVITPGARPEGDPPPPAHAAPPAAESDGAESDGAEGDAAEQPTDSVEVAMQPQQVVTEPGVAEQPVAEDEPVVDGRGDGEAGSVGRIDDDTVARLRPGDVAEQPIAIWSDDVADDIRGRWAHLQAQFIDDPQAAVDSAKELVAETVQTLSDRLLAEQHEFDPYRDTARPDTETMRVAMRRYREFLDRILAL